MEIDPWSGSQLELELWRRRMSEVKGEMDVIKERCAKGDTSKAGIEAMDFMVGMKVKEYVQLVANIEVNKYRWN